MFEQQLSLGFDQDLMIDSTKTQKKKVNKPKKKQKYEDIMKKLPASCFSCTTHPTDYLRLVQQPNTTRPACKSCGFKCSGSLGYLVCSKLASCYTLCSVCKVCTSNHILRKMNNLSHLSGNASYQKNLFKCHGCKKQKQASEQTQVYHCQVCLFDICHLCMKKTLNLWINKDALIQLKNSIDQE